MKKRIIIQVIYLTVIARPSLVSLSSRFTARALTMDRLIIEPEVIYSEVFKYKLLKHL